MKSKERGGNRDTALPEIHRQPLLASLKAIPKEHRLQTQPSFTQLHRGPGAVH